MKIHWQSLPPSFRVAAVAFAVHALLLVVDLVFFDSAYGGDRPHESLLPGLRIVASCLFAWSLLSRYPRPWLIGLTACFAFLIHDVMKLRDIFEGPPLGAPQRQLTAALFMSLLAGIGGSFAASGGGLFRRPAA